VHLKPTAGCQISTLIFDVSFGGGLYEYSMRNILRTTKTFPTWGVDQRYCVDLYQTEVPECLKPTAGCRISTLIFDFLLEVGLYEYPVNNILRTTNSCPLGNSIKCIGGAFN
jgi:hypothetical protein